MVALRCRPCRRPYSSLASGATAWASPRVSLATCGAGCVFCAGGAPAHSLLAPATATPTHL
eukprot:2846324-Pyramimonas_sp.AAC.1